MPYQYIDIVVPFIGILLIAGIITVVLRLIPFIYDYRFHRRRVDIVVFGGRFVIWKIENINNAYLINVFNPIDWFGNCSSRWRNYHLPNRFRLHWLVIHADGWVMFITPLNPTTALKTIAEGDKE